MDELFKSVFNNIVLFRHIYKYVRNECVKFTNRNELLEYREREYINKILYNSNEIIVKGDLPTDGILKEVKFYYSELSTIEGDAIPYGVEIIEFTTINNEDEGDECTPTITLSTLPPTIHTVNNVVIKDSDNNTIPPNITSIQFRECPIISNYTTDYHLFIKIPNTIKTLKFDEYWDNDGLKLLKGDIPEGVTNLEMVGFRLHDISKDILPNSIKQLSITCKFMVTTNQDDEGYFNSMPTNVEILKIILELTLTSDLKFTQYSSIKKLIIDFRYSNILPYSLPESITNLKLLNYSFLNEDYKIQKGVIPNSVTKLEFQFKYVNGEIQTDEEFIQIGSIPNSVKSLKLNIIINQSGIIPNSLTSLKLCCPIYKPISEETVSKLISLLPSSLTSVTLPLSFKNKNNNYKYHNMIIYK